MLLRVQSQNEITKELLRLGSVYVIIQPNDVTMHIKEPPQYHKTARMSNYHEQGGNDDSSYKIICGEHRNFSTSPIQMLRDDYLEGKV